MLDYDGHFVWLLLSALLWRCLISVTDSIENSINSSIVSLEWLLINKYKRGVIDVKKLLFLCVFFQQLIHRDIVILIIGYCLLYILGKALKLLLITLFKVLIWYLICKAITLNKILYYEEMFLASVKQTDLCQTYVN